MRAAVLTESHTFEVADVPDPSPRSDELVLRVNACGICGSDLKMHTMLPAGVVLGHEFCGEVVAVGADGREKWREGQQAAALPLTACGTCRWCLADEPAHCARVDLLGVGASPGAFAEYVRVAADRTVALNPAVGRFGALVEPLAVGLHTVAMGYIRAGDNALVIGGGNIGLAVTVWARRLGAREVVVSDPIAARRAIAGTFGATGAHDPTTDEPPRNFDVVFECVGSTGMVQAAIDAAATRGRVVIAGLCIAPDTVVPVTALLKEVEVRFAVYYRGSEFAAAAALLESGGIDADAFVTGQVGLDGVSGAFERLLTSTGDRKILVTPHG
jgi:(R,R)-butanediol dehydrogenase / meso-butanediol dehydrogenase / diacetyl reductase